MTGRRNQIMNAIESLFGGMTTIKNTSRRFQDFAQIGTELFPIAMISKPREKYPPRAARGLPATRTFSVQVTIIFSVGQDQTIVPDETVCDIMDEIDQTLAPPIGSQAQTLGGLVDHCYIEGEVICVPGDLDGTGMIDVPLTVVVP